MTSFLGEDLAGFGATAQRALTLAAGEAGDLGHPRLGTEHLLLGVLADGGTDAAAVLRAAGLSPSAARAKVREAVGPAVTETTTPTLTARAQRALRRAPRFARDQQAAAVDATHLLLAVLDVEGTAGQVLRGVGVEPDQLRAALTQPGDEPTEALTTTATAAPTSTGHAPHPAVCPGCRAFVGGGVAGERATVAGEPDLEVVVISCQTCGSVLGVVPAPPA